MLRSAPFAAVLMPMSDNGIYQVLCSLPFLVATVTRKAKPELRRCSRRPHHPLVGPNPLKFEAVESWHTVCSLLDKLVDESVQSVPSPYQANNSALPTEVVGKVLPKLRSLQAVIARAPKTVVVTDLYKTTYYIEKLACGHELTIYPQAHSITAKRRNCVTCAKLKFATDSPQFPVAKEAAERALPLPPKSVRLNSKNEEIA
jgi:hypothetical protein